MKRPSLSYFGKLYIFYCIPMKEQAFEPRQLSEQNVTKEALELGDLVVNNIFSTILVSFTYD